MKKILIIFIFLLYGCGNPTPKVLPKSEFLPDAVINEPYQASITITGGALNEKKRLGKNSSYWLRTNMESKR
ncbi:hypothetical protein [Xenorhabdus nematophila]|uniref:hypothetical protein n=1 Tax=Xenorhabdus nematophila TaxID=628 RepID=UPI000AAB505D|nr:hypothetical protein [Xenorhabdus nematophila]